MTTATLEAPVARRPGRRLDQTTRDAILSDIGKGKDSYISIAHRYNTSENTVYKLAQMRGLSSPFSPRLARTDAAQRAMDRERKAHQALATKPLDELDADTLSRITERASTTLHAHLGALEKSNTPAATIVLAPDMRIMFNLFVGAAQPAQIEPVNIIDHEISND